MKAGTLAKNQHYVPQFLLKHFAANKRNQICTFDKQTGNSFRTAIRNVAAENQFYNFDFEGDTLTIEFGLQEFEGQASRLVNRILETESLANLSIDDAAILALFVAIQRLRVRHVREEVKHTMLQIEEWLHGLGADPEKVTNFRVPNENDLKDLSAQLIMSAHEYVPHIADKTWILFKTSRKHPFYISDNPVTLRNAHGFGLRGNIGFTVPGIEIYLPLSKQITLALFCSSYEERIRENHNKLSEIRGESPEAAQALDRKYSLSELVRAMDTGSTVRCNPPHVEFLNCLQVAYAERFIFSPDDDFSLANAMVNENERYRSGPRSTIA